MRRVAAAAATIAGALGMSAGALGVSAADAGAAGLPVTIQFQAFAPYAVDALQGDAVTWSNRGGRTHTVTANDGTFDSGGVLVGQAFSRTFTAPGTYAYHCTIHRGMYGEVDVRRVILNPLPPVAVAARSAVVLSGRAADPESPVRVQSDTGAGFQTVAAAGPRADGTWRATLTAIKTARIRALSGTDASETRPLLVVNRAVHVGVTRRGIAVRVAPSAPHALVALQFRLRDRFGWWSVAVASLDRRSEVTFPHGLRRTAPARVVLLGADHWTPLAVSRVIRPTAA